MDNETQHGSDSSQNAIKKVEQLERERRALDNILRDRVQQLIEAARKEGFEVGYRAGKLETLHRVMK